MPVLRGAGAKCRSEGKSRCLLVTVDDAHGLGRPCADALAFVARRISPATGIARRSPTVDRSSTSSERSTR